MNTTDKEFQKDFKEFLQQFQTSNKLELASSLLRTKYAREEVGEDNDKREKQLDKSNELLEEIQKSLEKMTKSYQVSSDKIIKKLDQTAKYNPLSNIKDREPVTFTEQLKSGVAGTKRLGSAIATGVGALGQGIKALATKPKETIQAAGTFVGTKLADKEIGIENYVKDILRTSKEYTVEGGRFGEAYSKTAEGSRFQKGGKGSIDVGIENFNALKEKEEKIKSVEADIKKQKDYGFEVPKGMQEELDKLKKEFAELDIRNKGKKSEEIVSSKPEKAFNPEADNITTSSEILADNSKEQTNLLGDLLKTTQDSNTVLKDIREYLKPQITSGETSGTEKKSLLDQFGNPLASVEPAGGSSIPDIEFDRKGSKTPSGKSGGGKSLGSKMLGGAKALASKIPGGALKGGAAALGGMALSYGGEKLKEAGYEGAGGAMDVAGTTASYAGTGAMIGSFVPGIGTAIGAGIGGAIGLGKGLYDNWSSMFGGKKTTTKRITMSTQEDIKVNQLAFYQNDPEGFEEYQKFIRDERDKGKKQIEEDFKSGKMKGSKETFLEQLEDDVQERARAKFKDKLMAAGALNGKKATIEDLARALSRKARDQDIKSTIEKGTRQDKILKDEFSDRMAKVGAYNKETGEYDKSKFAEKDPEGHAQMMKRFAQDDNEQRASKIQGYSNPPGPDSQQKEYDKRVEDKLSAYPPKMREDVGIRGDAEDEVSIEMNYTPSSKREQTPSLDDQIAAKKSELSAQSRRSTPKSLERVKTLNKELADLEAKKMTQSQVPATSAENAAMREEIATSGSVTPVIASTVNNNNSTNYVPVKSQPRSEATSSLARYQDRVAVY